MTPGDPPDTLSPIPPLSRRETGFAARGGWWVLGQSVLMLAVIVSGLLWSGQWHSSVSFVAGWVLLTLGGALGIAGVVHLGAARTAFPRPLRQRALVTSGVYAWVRHPLYSSVMVASTGWALIGSSWASLGCAIFLAVFLDAKARREERWLRVVYPDYAAYARRVRRMVPGVY